MDCKRCKHNFVCKYKEDFKDVKMDFSIDEYKGVFDISCNEYLEDNDEISPFENMKYGKSEPKIENGCKGYHIGDHVVIHSNPIIDHGVITRITDNEIEIERGTRRSYLIENISLICLY